MPTLHRLGGLLVASDLPLPSLPEVSHGPPGDGSLPASDLQRVAPSGDVTDPPDATRVDSITSPVEPIGLVIALEPRADRRLPGPGGWIVERTLPGAPEPYLRVGGTAERPVLVHTRGIDVEVREGGRRFAVTYLDPALDPEDVEHLLLDQLLPLVMGRLGRLSLHGSAVAWGDDAVAFLGPSGAGKSTLAACAVGHRDAQLIADDQVVLEPATEGFLIHPAYPSVRLWSDSAGAVFAPRAEGERKHRIELPTVDGPRRLRAIAVIERGRALEVAAARPRDALAEVAPHVDRLDPGDRAALRRELEMLSRLCEVTRILRVTVPAGYGALGEVLDAVRRGALDD